MGRFLHGLRRTTEIVMLLMAFMFTCRSAISQTKEADEESKNSKSPQANVSSSLKQLQGKWKSVKSPYKDVIDFEGWAIRFRGDNVTEIPPGTKEEDSEAVTFTVDESKAPMWIDFDQQKGIFQIKGDILIVCFGDDEKLRPTEFNLAPAPAEAHVVSPGAYPLLPPRAPGVGYWVPYDLKWDDGRPKLLVFKKVP